MHPVILYFCKVFVRRRHREERGERELFWGFTNGTSNFEKSPFGGKAGSGSSAQGCKCHVVILPQPLP